jgi:hypothetical protein
MGWLEETFNVAKPIIGMVHLPPLPGTPLAPATVSVTSLVDRVLADVQALQQGGVDGLLFCNENDRPYTLTAGPEVVATMAGVITSVAPSVRMPFGVDVLWDPIAAIAVAKATGATFVRGVFTGAYAGDFGVWNTEAGRVWRYRRAIGADDVRLFYNINAEFASSLAPRPIEDVARSVVMSSLAEVLCVSGSMTGEEVSDEDVMKIRRAGLPVALLANTGVSARNVERKLAVVDGAIIGTSFKTDGITWNPVDPRRVVELMKIVRAVRAAAGGARVTS